MKEKLSFLLKRNDKIGASPIMIIGLGGVIIFALLYFFVFSQDESPNSEPNNAGTSEEESFMDKVKGIFSFGDSPDENPQNPSNIPDIPTIPDGISKIDEELIKEEPEVNPENLTLELDKAEIDYVGRRDPMNKIIGDANGTYDEDNFNDAHADMKDESKNYFDGISVEEISLDNISYDKMGDSKLRGTFIVQGSIIPDLEVGDYLLELYYIKEFNLKDNYVIIQYKDKEDELRSISYKLKSQYILDNTKYNLDENGIPFNK